MEHTIAQNKAPCFGGRAPLFSQRDLLRLVGPLLVEQLLAVTVGMADTRWSPAAAKPPSRVSAWWI